MGAPSRQEIAFISGVVLIGDVPVTPCVARMSQHAPSDLARLEAEIVLLREDNARLRLGQAQMPDAGRLVERLRVLVERCPDGALRDREDQGDEIWQILSEATLVRNVLIDVCAEIGQVVVTLQSRLDDLVPQARFGEANDHDRKRAS